MKYRNRIGIVFLLLMLGALVALLCLTQPKVREKRDMVAYNDEICRVYEAYLAGTPVEVLEEKYECTIAIGKGAEAKAMRGYAEYALVMDFAPEGEAIGKIIWSDVDREDVESAASFRRLALILWGILLFAGLALLVLIDRFLLRPVRDMQGMVSEIAKGNLDVPLPIRKHNPFGGLVEGFDLMREELRASREREIEAEKAKKELVAELAHDIKTPVATIRATCEVLELKQQRRLGQLSQESDVADARDVLEKTQTIAHKADMIENLMGSVFEATLAELDRIEVNPQEESSERIEEYFRNLRNYGNIILENPIPPCLVCMDRVRMEQVIDNVVGNSHKYAGTDIHVRFDETEGKDPDGKPVKYISIRIKDDGPGAPEDEIPLLMSKYYRGSTAKDKAGFGMGLYLVRTYMEKQGGGAEIYNDNGFVVNLFLRKV
ncbi:MAG: HAMP domain-containing histidine kinase [Lachnospiraceae bacterium]|nr:HAMP domain-containing histidine kinase [Lachnospiraceae bacterium]